MTEQKKPLLLIIAGPNCSGKTTEFYLARDIDATMSQEQYVNADEIARELLLKGEYSSKDINQLDEQEGNLVNYIAARKCAERRNKLMEQGADLATETVASTPRVLSIIDSGRQHGYMVSVNFVILRKDDLNVYRVADRVANGGHGVPAVGRASGNQHPLLADQLERVKGLLCNVDFGKSHRVSLLW